MKKLIRSFLVILSLVGVVALVPAAATHASPADDIKSGVSAVDSGSNKCTDAKTGAVRDCNLGDQIRTVVNILLYILGAIAVVMIVIGGIRYTTSNGESSSIKSAKDTILYSVIGLVVAIMAFAIINFVLTAFTSAK